MEALAAAVAEAELPCAVPHAITQPTMSSEHDCDHYQDDDDDFDVFETMDDSPTKIHQGLYIGSFLSEQNLAALKEAGISHVLQVANGITPSHPSQFKYKEVDVQDVDTADLVQHFGDCFEFIDAGVKHGGVSRSATVCIGYLMWKERLSYEDAFKRVHQRRPWINPNPGFKAQLELFEQLGCDLTNWDGWKGAASPLFGKAVQQ